jgi:hypothetical protein
MRGATVDEIEGFETDDADGELSRVKAEYAEFRTNVINVGQAEAVRRGWCDEWREIARRMGIRADELPPTHADVKVNVGGTEIAVTIPLNRNGALRPQEVLAYLGDELRYGETAIKLRKDDSWYTAMPVPLEDL